MTVSKLHDLRLVNIYSFIRNGLLNLPCSRKQVWRIFVSMGKLVPGGKDPNSLIFNPRKGSLCLAPAGSVEKALVAFGVLLVFIVLFSSGFVMRIRTKAALS